MRFAILGDIHSNLEALNAVLEDLEKLKIDKIFCVGDVVGYGADPAECVKTAEERFELTVAGNHDMAVIDKLNLGWFKDSAAKAIVWTKDALSMAEKEYLNELPLIDVYQDIVFAHGSLYHPEEFYYLTNKTQIMKNFDFQEDKKICFTGHSHKPFVALFDDVIGDAFICANQEVHVEKHKRYLVDAGSVGQPRDGDPRASYVFYDEDEGLIEIKRVDYDIAQASANILSAGLPSEFAERLHNGV